MSDLVVDTRSNADPQALVERALALSPGDRERLVLQTMVALGIRSNEQQEALASVQGQLSEVKTQLNRFKLAGLDGWGRVFSSEKNWQFRVAEAYLVVLPDADWSDVESVVAHNKTVRDQISRHVWSPSQEAIQQYRNQIGVFFDEVPHQVIAHLDRRSWNPPTPGTPSDLLYGHCVEEAAIDSAVSCMRVYARCWLQQHPAASWDQLNQAIESAKESIEAANHPWVSVSRFEYLLNRSTERQVAEQITEAQRKYNDERFSWRARLDTLVGPTVAGALLTCFCHPCRREWSMLGEPCINNDDTHLRFGELAGMIRTEQCKLTDCQCRLCIRECTWVQEWD